MERCSPSFSLLHLIPLTLHAQIPFAFGFPFAPEHVAGHALNRLRPAPLFWSVSGIEYTTLSTTVSADDSWLSTIPVYQIGDGQIQAPYVGSTEEPPEGSDNAATLASRNEYTVSASMSTTSVLIERGSTTPGPNPASTAVQPTQTSGFPAGGNGEQSFVTSVPDQSLTSLTTSEVQTVSGPPPSDTSGVSKALSSLLLSSFFKCEIIQRPAKEHPSSKILTNVM